MNEKTKAWLWGLATGISFMVGVFLGLLPYVTFHF